ncbi:MAG: fasciclin domain-containing protein [Planctomycetota bacterium]
MPRSQPVRLTRSRLLIAAAACSLGAVTLGGIPASQAFADHHSRQTSGPGDLIDVGTAAGNFTTLGAALEAAGLIDALRGDGPFTVLAPTDAAFAALPDGVVETLLRPENKDLLTSVLTYHVVPGKVLAAQAAAAGQAETLNGAAVGFAIDNGRLEVNEVNVVATDVAASNGVIHAIDAVLLPPGFELPDNNAKHSASVDEIIELAIKRGVPMYNRGQHAACAAIYEVTLLALTSHPDIHDAGKSLAMRTLKDGRNVHGMDARAWAFRRGLDTMRQEMMAAR